jgi:hypothetical protein
MLMKLAAGLGLAWAMLPGNAFGESAAPVEPTAAVATATATAPTVGKIAPYRTWITIESFEMIQNGEPQNPISNVKLEVSFPDGSKFELPEGGQYWTIGNGQIQDIKRTYELPWSAITNDGFAMSVQMVRKGSKMLPCNFTVNQLSQFNRAYFCRTDLAWQLERKIPEDRQDKEGIQVRVWTDRNTPVKEQPKDALALRK